MAQSARAKSSQGKTRKGAKRPRKLKTRPEPKTGQANMQKAMGHPTRLQILAVAHQRPISPSQFAKAHDKTLGSVAYHFRKLREYEAIKLWKLEPTGGSARHMYVGTKRAIYTESEWPKFPESIQAGLAGATLEDFVGVTGQAIESGAFTGREDFVFTWDELELDTISWTKLGKMLRLVWQKVPSLEDETEIRVEAGGEKPFRVIVGLAAFEGAPKVEPSKSARKAAKKARTKKPTKK